MALKDMIIAEIEKRKLSRDENDFQNNMTIYENRHKKAKKNIIERIKTQASIHMYLKSL